MSDDKPKTIEKKCETLKAAERFQNRLYDQYDSVKLVRFPRYSENGTYAWEVAKPTGA